MSKCQSKKVSKLFEDDEICVFFLPGTSHYLLVTFGDLFSLFSGERFFADTPCEKLGISCIGFVAKKANWYPGHSVDNAIKLIAEIVGSYKVIITYGGSMGGYAAVKYSSKLDSSYTVALCPQWSLDKEECKGIDPGWQQHFSSSLRNMSIKTSDINGAIVVIVADMLDDKDNFHAQKIQELSDNVVIINVPRIGHNVTPMLAGTKNLVDILDAIQVNDIDKIRAICSSNRKKYHTRQADVISFCRVRFPVLMNKKIYLRFRTEKNFSVENPHLIHAAIDYCIHISNYAAAVSLVSGLGTARAQWMAINYLAKASSSTICLKTCHGSILCFSHIESCVIHATELTSDLSPVRISIIGSQCYFFVEWLSCIIYFSVRNGSLVPTLSADEKSEAKVNLKDNGRWTFLMGKKFVCAKPASKFHGKLHVDRDVANEWEEFDLGIV